MNPELIAKLRALRLLAFDVDGVMTDGAIVLGLDEELKQFDVKDGAGVVLARRSGLLTAIVTGRESRCVIRRAEELQITELHQSVTDKVAVLRQMAERNGIESGQILYMGDDLPDLGALEFAGVSAAPADAAAEVRALADIVTEARGGHGAVRELCEVVLRAQGKWDAIVAEYKAKGTES